MARSFGADFYPRQKPDSTGKLGRPARMALTQVFWYMSDTNPLLTERFADDFEGTSLEEMIEFTAGASVSSARPGPRTFPEGDHAIREKAIAELFSYALTVENDTHTKLLLKGDGTWTPRDGVDRLGIQGKLKISMKYAAAAFDKAMWSPFSIWGRVFSVDTGTNTVTFYKAGGYLDNAVQTNGIKLFQGEYNKPFVWTQSHNTYRALSETGQFARGGNVRVSKVLAMDFKNAQVRFDYLPPGLAKGHVCRPDWTIDLLRNESAMPTPLLNIIDDGTLQPVLHGIDRSEDDYRQLWKSTVIGPESSAFDDFDVSTIPDLMIQMSFVAPADKLDIYVPPELQESFYQVYAPILRFVDPAKNQPNIGYSGLPAFIIPGVDSPVKPRRSQFMPADHISFVGRENNGNGSLSTLCIAGPKTGASKDFKSSWVPVTRGMGPELERRARSNIFVADYEKLLTTICFLPHFSSKRWGLRNSGHGGSDRT